MGNDLRRRRRCAATRATLLWLCLLVVGGLFPATAPAEPAPLYILTVAAAISPGSAGHVTDGIDRANADGAAALVIELDTPGGLAEAMRTIVQAIYASRVPIIVYVAPSGARAASAGVMVTMAADVAAMAPGTNIGAAHPVAGGGKEIGGHLADKVTNDMVAYVRSIAVKRGRNADWAETAVRESVSVTAGEALQKNIIDLVARDVDDLVVQLEGRRIEGKGTLSLAGAERRRLHESLRTRVLKIISDPNIAYILMMIGLAGLYFELSHPGAVFPGVVGGIAIILAFFAFQTLPVNIAGLLLIVLALIFFILEMKVTSYGLLSVAGLVSLLLGSLMLFDRSIPGLRLAWRVLLPTVLLVGGFFVTVAGLAFRAQIGQPKTGAAGLVGETGVVRQALRPEGKVFVHGELWAARSKTPLAAGTRIRVRRVEGLMLEVEPLDADA